MLLARREPGNQKATNEMFIVEGTTVDVPLRIEEPNATSEQVRRMLDQLAGLSNLEIEPDAPTSYRDRASFRDTVAFAFQPQSTIANQSILFYRADSQDHREKLRAIFPFVLGALSPTILAKQHELAELRRDLARKERELATVRDTSFRWLGELRAWIREARELGLVVTEVDDGTPASDLLEILRRAVARSDRDLAITETTISGAVRELVGLEKQEREVGTELSTLRRRYARMSTLLGATTDYKSHLAIQRERLGIAQWLTTLYERDSTCPACGGITTVVDEQLRGILDALAASERDATALSGTPEAFEREFGRVKTALRLTTERLDALRHQIRAVTNASEAAKARHDEGVSVSRFIGRVEQALETYERLVSDDGLAAEVEDLRGRAEALASEIAAAGVEARVERATRRVAAKAERLLRTLDCEWPDDPIALSVRDLSVKVIRGEREDYLWEIGSGSNWLSYHLAVSIGLQEFFLEQPQSPVPSFLVFDQPSQVYFPRRLAALNRAEADDPSTEPAWTDDDVVAVRKAFSTIADATMSALGGLQTIILDHATDDVWGGIPYIHVAADWREGRKLVPMEWVRAGASPERSEEPEAQG
jgi:hypothetical protein